jgi:hypothetical protein
MFIATSDVFVQFASIPPRGITTRKLEDAERILEEDAYLRKDIRILDVHISKRDDWIYFIWVISDKTDSKHAAFFEAEKKKVLDMLWENGPKTKGDR